jgi:PAS domain S-box-containing protein
VEFCNTRLLEYCGTDIAAFQGARWVDYIHPEDVRLGRDHWLHRISEARPFATEYRIRRADGRYRWHLTHTAPLHDARERIYGWVAVSIDVDDRHTAEDDVLKVAEELRRASAAKDEFLGLVSHELRTPITTIYGNAQVLRRTVGQLDVETLSLSLGDIEQETLRLQQLVDNMFVLARVDAGVPILTEPVLLSRIVERVVHEQLLRVPARPITVANQLGTDPVAGEELYIEQILRNLISNANKYGTPKQPIVVSIEPDGEHAVIRVRNRGGTPPSEEIPHMFEAFYRSPGLAGRVQGAGIGLTVCKRLTEAMGGDIWLRPHDDGLEAGFSLPLETEAL